MNSNKQLMRQKPKLLLHVGYNKPKTGWFSSLHSHTHCEIMFVKHGKGKIRIDNDEYPFTDGDIVVYNPYTMHVEYFDDVPERELVFLSVANLNVEGYEKGCLCAEKFAILKSGAYFNQFVFCLEQMILEQSVKDVQYSQIRENYFNILISLIIRFSSGVDNTQGDNETFLRIKEYFDAHYTSIENLDDVCKELFLSKYYLTHLFTENCGIPPLQYIISKRMSLARTLLINTDDKISEIAKKCGYYDVAYFNRVFKKRFNSTPLLFRTQYIASNLNVASQQNDTNA